MNQETPRSKSKSNVKVAVWVVVGVLAVGTLFCGGTFFLANSLTQPAADAATRHLETIREGQIRRAYDEQTTRTFRQQISYARYARVAENIRPALQKSEVNLPNRRVVNDEARVSGHIGEHPYAIRLRKENGEWKVVGLGPPETVSQLD